MKQLLIIAAAGFVALQTLLMFAIFAAAARPTPEFEPEAPKTAAIEEEEENLELVS